MYSPSRETVGHGAGHAKLRNENFMGMWATVSLSRRFGEMIVFN